MLQLPPSFKNFVLEINWIRASMDASPLNLSSSPPYNLNHRVTTIELSQMTFSSHTNLWLLIRNHFRFLINIASINGTLLS
jgi:hypothetical protein